MVNTKVDLCSITLDNPIIPASGTFGFGHEFANLYDMGNQVESICEDKDVYVVGASGNGKYGIAITYYCENDNVGAKKIVLDIEGYDATRLNIIL